MQTTEDSPPKNNNLPCSFDCIYLQAADALQGGRDLMDIATGQMINCPIITACTMAKMVIESVELITTRQGYKPLKYFNRRKQEMNL